MRARARNVGIGKGRKRGRGYEGRQRGGKRERKSGREYTFYLSRLVSAKTFWFKNWTYIECRVEFACNSLNKPKMMKHSCKRTLRRCSRKLQVAIIATNTETHCFLITIIGELNEMSTMFTRKVMTNAVLPTAKMFDYFFKRPCILQIMNQKIVSKTIYMKSGFHRFEKMKRTEGWV